ncbi:MAG: hypothetical protein OQK82_03785 [Candidatus Pacearchaeota archaeon]|nr:hypothetical protein [Candidatus Pacearchaeota archaeon]
MKRRGMSQVITTVIMIGIVLVAIGAVWIVAQNILNQGLEDVSLGSLKISLDIEQVKVNNDGVIVGNTDYSVEEFYGKACSFDGEGDYVDVGERDNLQINGGVTQVVWINQQGSSENDFIIRQGQEYDLRYSMYYRNTERLYFYWYDGSSF